MKKMDHQVFRCKIAVKEFHSKIQRRIQVPETYTFRALPTVAP